MPRLLKPSLLRRSVQLQGINRLLDCASTCSTHIPADLSPPGCRCTFCRGSMDQTRPSVADHRHLSSGATGCFGPACSCSACRSQTAVPSSSGFVEQQLQQARGLRVRQLSLGMRLFSTIQDHQDEIEAINEAFVEARDEIEYAKEDSETVYFNEAHETAKAAVSNALSKFDALLADLAKPEAEKLQRSMGMKMQQLKAELLELDELHA